MRAGRIGREDDAVSMGPFSYSLLRLGLDSARFGSTRGHYWLFSRLGGRMGKLAALYIPSTYHMYLPHTGRKLFFLSPPFFFWVSPTRMHACSFIIRM